MQNRAKCKLCQTIIESMHMHDYVTCKCGEISVDGGPHYMRCAAKDFSNFLRVDDEGNEIVVKVESKTAPDTGFSEDISKKPTKEELLKMISDLCESFERLPPQAAMTPITHADLAGVVFLILAVFKAKE